LIRSFLAELADIWNRLFQRKAKQKAAAPESAAAVEGPARRAPAFSDFKNPFATGGAESLTQRQLVVYTFQALEAWARERDAAREPDQTALEFAEAIGRRFSPIADDANRLAGSYCRIAYANRDVSRASAMSLEALWRKMSSMPAAGTAPATQ
jgi:hypothetical protein